MLDKKIVSIGSLIKVDEYDHLMVVDAFRYDGIKSVGVSVIDNHSYPFNEIEEVWNKVDDVTYKRQYKRGVE